MAATISLDHISMDKLQQEVEEDLDFNIMDAEKIALGVSKLKNKYCRYMYLAKGVLKSAEQDLKRVYAKRHKYYAYDHQVKFNRSDLQIQIEADETYQNQAKKVELHKLRVEYLEGVLKAIDQLSFNVSNAIKWHIYTNGG